jgi:hypothetical protein
MFFPGFTNYFIKIIQKKDGGKDKGPGAESKPPPWENRGI